uniref:Ig-like domain-containing protein n=1 Tax=Cairina moschata TaxID=8855 RepID=A0A8C3CLN2_CAIMO
MAQGTDSQKRGKPARGWGTGAVPTARPGAEHPAPRTPSSGAPGADRRHRNELRREPCLDQVIACQALVAPREVSGRAGQALSLNCWYAPGYQGYNKYWCRGASRDSCRKVVETAGREAPRQHGRVSIADNHVFCLVLLTLEELSEEDAGSYWCGVERVGRDIMTPVTIRVLPARPRTTPDASVRAVPANPAATPSPWLSDATPELLSTANSTNATATGPPWSALSAPVPTAVLLSLLAVAGSAGLVYALWRRREGKGTQGCHCAHPGHSRTHLGSRAGQELGGFVACAALPRLFLLPPDLQRPPGAVRSKPKDWAQPHHTASARRAPPRDHRSPRAPPAAAALGHPCVPGGTAGAPRAGPAAP